MNRVCTFGCLQQLLTLSVKVLAWQASDRITTSPSRTSSIPPQTASATLESAEGSNGLHYGPSKAIIGGISALCVILLLVSILLFYLALRRRKRKLEVRAQPEEPELQETAENIEGNEHGRAELEDPEYLRRLETQTGSYQGKPELENHVNSVWNDVDRSKETSQSEKQEQSPGLASSAGTCQEWTPGQARLVELE